MIAETRAAADQTRAPLALFAAAVLLSAALLFVVQPMFARMVLPMMGGTPATWTTCLLFFQITLLLGYLYVHVTSARLSDRAQAVVHVLLLLTVVAVFPLAAPVAAPPSRGAPVVWLLSTLATCVGLPFLAVSGTAPLLQRWYARASGRDPYFLYAASNLGSLVGLLGYPLVVERSLTLAGQRRAWSIGFAVLAVFIAGVRGYRLAAPVAIRRAGGGHRRRAGAVGPGHRPGLVAGAGAGAVEPPARGDHAHLYRCRRGAAALGGAPGNLPAQLRRRLRLAAADLHIGGSRVSSRWPSLRR